MAALTLALILYAQGAYFRSDDFEVLAWVESRVSPHPLSAFTAADQNGWYRPLAVLPPFVNLLLWGLTLTPYLLTGLGIHLLNLALGFLLVRRFSQDGVIPYAFLLLALVQVHTYLWVLTWPAAVDRLLGTAFALGSALVVLRPHPAGLRKGLFPLLGGGLLLVAGSLAWDGVLSMLLLPALWLLGLALWPRLLASGSALRLAPWLALALMGAGLSLALGIVVVKGWIIGTPYRGYTGPDLGEFLANGSFMAASLSLMPLLAGMAYLVGGWLRGGGPMPALGTQDKGLILFGALWALCGVPTLLTVKWSSPTHLYLPGFGSAIIAAVLLARTLSGERRQVWYGLLVGGTLYAILFVAGAYHLLVNLRWLEWGPTTRGILSQLRAYYPSPPQDAVFLLVDGDAEQGFGLTRLFGNNVGRGVTAAVRLWYQREDLVAKVVVPAQVGALERLVQGRRCFLLWYRAGHLEPQDAPPCPSQAGRP